MDETQVTLRTSDFDYELPPELIAQTPPAVRGESRLLVVRRNDASTPGGKRSGSHQDGSGTLIIPPTGTVDRATLFSCQDGSFSDVVGLIPAGDLLVLNSTRVRHARLLGRRPSGAPAEVLLLHPAAGGEWIAMGKPGSALLPGKQIELGEGISIETLEVLADGYRRVRVVGASAEAAMRRVGRLPLPPYIERDPTPDDDARYQTVYAEREGSVAAPTAGLHFTHAMLSALAAKGAGIARLELEVGPGTFKPVEEEDPSRHPMHPERFEIPEAAAAAIAVTRRRGAAVWAVGTTVVRALESAAAPDGTVRPGAGETRLMITPGYRFRVVDHLITNFHLPRSTLLMLVSAFAGHDAAMAAYRIAVQLRYRFYSYGDAMAIL